jgi:hypothetical protein
MRQHRTVGQPSDRIHRHGLMERHIHFTSMERLQGVIETSSVYHHYEATGENRKRWIIFLQKARKDDGGFRFTNRGVQVIEAKSLGF